MPIGPKEADLRAAIRKGYWWDKELDKEMKRPAQSPEAQADARTGFAGAIPKNKDGSLNCEGVGATCDAEKVQADTEKEKKEEAKEENNDAKKEAEKIVKEEKEKEEKKEKGEEPPVEAPGADGKAAAPDVPPELAGASLSQINRHHLHH